MSGKYEEILWTQCIQEAAGSYLTAYLPTGWRDMEDEDLFAWIEDHVVEWLEGYKGEELLGLIMNSGESLYTFIEMNKELISNTYAA